MKWHSSFLLNAVIVLSIYACSQEMIDQKKVQQEEPPQHFQKVSPQLSNITFGNPIHETVNFNYFTYPFIYFGGGVSTGDINNDGLPDIYLTSNMDHNALYLNKGGLQFEDITKTAGVSGIWNRWTTGTTMADVNSDGYLDIYVCAAGPKEERGNLLYLNGGDNTFVESGVSFGIADPGHSIQAAFWDYDLDGDLDLYVANYPQEGFANTVDFFASKMKSPELETSDKLYKNEGGIFRDVTIESGILNYGLSLGISIADYNQDHWPDIYVSNDFNSADFLYINNQDGTFQNVIHSYTGHTSNFGMGIDAADINNDALVDILQLDMMASNNEQQKANMSAMNPEQFSEVVNGGLHHQYMKNTLQLNTGQGFFSEISELAGIAYTGWSWGSLLMDMDNDGYKDIFITNGMRRNVNDNDFNAYLRIQGAYKQIEQDQYFQLLDQIPVQPVDNFAFHNKGNLKFKKTNSDYGLNHKGFSNGAAYADFDLDGDLDIIVNNLDDTSSLFENISPSDHPNHFLRLQLESDSPNRFVIGAEVFLYAQGEQNYQYLQLTRGYQSSVEPIVHFGLGQIGKIDSMKIIWPNGEVQLVNNPRIDQLIKITQPNKTDQIYNYKIPLKSGIVVVPPDLNPIFSHQENIFDDFKRETLLPHKMSRMGPALAVGDVNADGRDDFYVGGALGYAGRLYIQHDDDHFNASQSSLWSRKSESEDTAAHFFDAEGDGDLDLYIVSGGNERPEENNHFYKDKLYINDGQGQFADFSNSLPDIRISGSCVKSTDFDQDGDLDLFVGGRQSPGKYPQPASSYILINDSKGGKILFADRSQVVAPDLSNIGMVTDAVWADLNGDSWKELVIVGEWMPLRIMTNKKGILRDEDRNSNFTDHRGWWYTIEAADIDKDGDIDLVAGNLGLNYKYKASLERPFKMFSGDLDKNGSLDIVLGYYEADILYPLRGRECSAQQIPSIKKKFPNYTAFSKATLSDVYPPDILKDASSYAATNFASTIFINKDETLSPRALPNLAQISSIEAIAIADINNDSHLDFIIGGNEFDSEVETPRSDASICLLLAGDGLGNFNPVPPIESGIKIRGEVKDIIPIRLSQAIGYLVAINDQPLKLILPNEASVN